MRGGAVIRGFSAGWGSRETLNVTLVEPELVGEVGVAVARDAAGRWRHSARRHRVRSDLCPTGIAPCSAPLLVGPSVKAGAEGERRLLQGAVSGDVPAQGVGQGDASGDAFTDRFPQDLASRQHQTLRDEAAAELVCSLPVRSVVEAPQLRGGLGIAVAHRDLAVLGVDEVGLADNELLAE